ncbi:hypothetical protein M1N16_01075 [Nitrospinaceae bacterium]|nr:hypothetical protein [Nitrospinaceae bacterium]
MSTEFVCKILSVEMGGGGAPSTLLAQIKKSINVKVWAVRQRLWIKFLRAIESHSRTSSQRS